MPGKQGQAGRSGSVKHSSESIGFFGRWFSKGPSSAEQYSETTLVAEASLGTNGAHFIPQATRSTLSASFRDNPGFDSSTIKSQQFNMEDARQTEIDASLQGFFGGYLIRSLNFVHRNLVRTRLAFRSDSFEENYYRYCYQQRAESYKQTLLNCEYHIDTQDEFGKWAHSRHLLKSVLPANLPIDTVDEAVNEANAQANQANWLLEQRIRKVIRKELAALKTKNKDPRDADSYDNLLSHLLFEIQDPDVKWVLLTDAVIAAGLLLEEEIILLETYGAQSNFATHLETKIDIPDSSAEKVNRGVQRASPAYRPQVNGVITVVLPTQEGYYLTPQAGYYLTPELLSAEDAAKYGKGVGEQRTYDQGAAAEGDEQKDGYDNTGKHAEGVSDDEQDPTYDAGAAGEEDPAYDMGDDAAAIIKMSTLAHNVESAAYSLGDSGDAATGGLEMPVYTLVTEGLGGDSLVRASTNQPVLAKQAKHSPPLERLQRNRNDSQGSGSHSSDSHLYSQASDEAVHSGSEGYMDVAPPLDDDGEAKPYAEVTGLKKEPNRAGSSLKYEQARQLPKLPRAPMAPPRQSWAAQSTEAPILPNPFKKPGQDDSELLPDALYDSLVRAIRRVLKSESESTLADLVRDQVERLTKANQSAPQLKAIQIVARLANREMATPGFNYLGGLQVSDDQYEELFSALAATVDAYRYYFAAEEGSVPAKPKERILNDNMENITPFISEFINLYLNQLRISLETKAPFQFSIIARPNIIGKEVKKNFFVVIKQGKPEGGCEKTCYQLNINAETSKASFVKTKKLFVSYHELDLHKPTAKPAESFGDDPTFYGYRDEEDQHFEVVAASNVKIEDPYLLPQERAQRIKQLKVALPAELLSTVSSSAIQYAYNKQESYSGLTNARRWLQTHPKTVAGIAVAAVAGGAAAAAYGAGLFNTPPCKGYINGQGGCSSGDMPNPQCSLVSDTTNVLAGGVVKITPSCSNLVAFQASSSQFLITNIPAGSQLSVNSQVIVSNFNATNFDVTPYIGQQVSVQLPPHQYGFYGDWTPTGSVAFHSGTQSFTGFISAPQAVHVEPVPGVASVALSQGSFSVNENTNATFTLSCAPAQGDSNVNLYISNLPIGDTLTWRATNGTVLQFTSTSANNGTSILSGVSFNQQFTYIPARNTWGTKGFSLSAKSVAGGVESATASAPLNLNYRIQGVPSPVVSINSPTVVNTVQNQYSTPFNLSATPASENTLVQQVVLQSGTSLCDVASSNCLTNNGVQAQTFSIPSTWGASVQYRSNLNGDGFSYLVQDTLDGAISAPTSVNISVNQLLLPVVTVTQGNSSAPVSQLSFDEDTATQFNLGVNIQNAANASVILQFPTITSSFSSGAVYQVNGTLANGFQVSSQVSPGGNLNIGNWNLSMPVFVMPPANVNHGNQNGNLNVGVQVMSQASNGLQAVVSSQLGLNIRPVPEDFTLIVPNPKMSSNDAPGILWTRQSLSKGFGGTFTVSSVVPGETIGNEVTYRGVPDGTTVGVGVTQNSLIFARSEGNGIFVTSSTALFFGGNAYRGNATVLPLSQNGTVQACAIDYDVTLCKQVPVTYQVR